MLYNNATRRATRHTEVGSPLYIVARYQTDFSARDDWKPSKTI